MCFCEIHRFQNLSCHQRHTFLTYFWLAAGGWKLVPGPFMVGFIKMTIYQGLAIFDSGHLPFSIVLYLPFQKNWTLESWHNWLLSNWSRLLNWKGPGALPQFSKLFKTFMKIIALAYINQLAKFGYLMSCGSKDTFKNAPCLMYYYSSWRHRFAKSWDLLKYKKFEDLKNRTQITFEIKKY